MDRAEHLLAAAAPGLLILAYSVVKTRISWRNQAVWTAFLLGGLGIFAALPLEIALHWAVNFAVASSTLWQAGIVALLVAAIPEEGIKYLILVGAVESHVDARRRQDLIALAAAVSLGFATVENFGFIVIPAKWLSVAAIRSLTAVPGHGIDGLAMGALLTAARLQTRRRTVWAALALIVPIIMHAAYDFPPLVFKAAGAADTYESWLTVFWPAVLTVESIIALGLCNWVLPAAKNADRQSGRDMEDATSSSLTGFIMIVLVVVAAISLVAALSKGIVPLALGIVLAILPLALGIDFIWTEVRRHGDKDFFASSP